MKLVNKKRRRGVSLKLVVHKKRRREVLKGLVVLNSRQSQTQSLKMGLRAAPVNNNSITTSPSVLKRLSF